MLCISLNRIRDFKLNTRQIMKSKKGQQIIYASVAVILVVALAVGYFFRPAITGITGNVVLSGGSGCSTIGVAAQYLIVGSPYCQGGSEAATCTVQLQNKEAISITAQPVFTCSTSSNQKTVTSSKMTLSSEEVGDFTISYDNSGNPWTCRIANAQTIKLAEVCS